MLSFWKIYRFIETRFFYTLTRKIVGNIGFLFLFQIANFVMIYEVNASGGGSMTSSNTTLISLFLMSGLSFIFTIVYLRYLIVRPVKALLKALQDINNVKGDLSIRLPEFTKDEFSTLSHEYNTFADNLVALLGDISNDANQASRANQTVSDIVSATDAKTKTQKSLSDDIGRATDSVGITINDIVSACERVMSTSQKNYKDAGAANEKLMISKAQIEEITSLLTSFSNTVDGLQDNAKNVRGILNVVEGFSDQTNLLALNATIEAARAGDIGRGFGVVADEVRTLSKKVDEATRQINQFLNGMELLVSNTQKESKHLTDVSCNMQSGVAQTMETFSDMMTDFKQNITAFELILSSVNLLKDQHQSTADTSTVITKLSDDIVQEMQNANKEAEQAKQLAHATQTGLKQFI